jgi:hypothetical protein
MVHDDAYERLLFFLADDEGYAPELDEDLLNEMVADAASLLSDLRAATDDLADAAVWRQVAVDAGHAQGNVELDEESHRSR